MSDHFKSNPHANRMCFFTPQLDIICVELALAMVSAGQTRYELLGLIAAGEYALHSLHHRASMPVVSFLPVVCSFIAILSHVAS